MKEKQDDYLDYLNLPPTSNAEDIKEYSEVLDYCLNNDDILNIAISGAYGAGKSSFLKTYFSNIDNTKKISISLGKYEKKTTNSKKKNSNEYYQSIEKSILQQLLYQVNERDVPLSRFKRIIVYSKEELLIKCSVFFIFLVLTIMTLFPVILENNIRNLLLVYYSLSHISNVRFFFFNIDFALLFSILMYFFAYCFIDYLFFKFVELLRNKISISKFKFKDAEIEITSKSESIFNKYLDEIIYFFQSTNFEYVIIEDLDRFEDSTLFIQKLKELNQLINSSSKINRKIKFIFAIRDDFFSDSKERTKFFDKIIPIVPISSYSNSNEIIWEKFKKVYGEKKQFGDITKKFINDISIFVEDMRIINNIISEFIIYHDKFINKGLDDKKLFAIIMYKNLYPKEYSNLLLGEGVFPNTFKNLSKKIDNKTSAFKESIEILNSQKNDVLNEFLLNSKELKQIFLFNILNFNYQRSYQYLYFNGNKVLCSEFLDDKFDISRIKNETITFYNYSKTLTEFEIFEFFGGKNKFIFRLDTLEKTKEKKLAEIQYSIDSIKKQIESIYDKNLFELVELYGAPEFIDCENEYETFVLKKGYVTKDFDDYISIFKEGNLTNNDMKFIKSVKKDEKNDFLYSLYNIDEIISRLDLIDFCNKSILNINLIDHMLNKSSKYSKELQKFYLLFNVIDSETFDFIVKYENFGGKFDFFITNIINSSTNLWEYIYENKIGDYECIDKWVILYLEKYKMIDKISYTFIEYLNNSKNIINKFDKSKIDIYIKSLVKLNVKFCNLTRVDNVNDKIFLDIYNNNLYEFNYNMLKLFFDFFEIKFESNRFLSELYENDKLESMKDYVIKNFKRFINVFFLENDGYVDNNDTIIKLLNDSHVDNSDKETLIMRENVIFDDIESIEDKNLYDYLFFNNKLKNNSANILSMYKENEELNANIVSMINSNITSLYDFIITNDPLVKALQYDILTCNEINYFDDSFCMVIDSFDKIVELNTFDLNDSLINQLIYKNLLVFNKHNFEFIKKNYSNMLYQFINCNKKQYFENNLEYDISDNDIDLLLNDYLDTEVKQFLVDNEKVNLDDYTTDELYDLSIKDCIYHSNISDKIMNSNINQKYKIKYLSKVKDKITSDEILTYFSKFVGQYKYIGTKYAVVDVVYDENLILILEKLENDNIISSFKIGKNENILIYNKKSRL